ncbi:MAG: disulfide bond formation protein B [Chlamydiales bacterium]
MPKTDRFMMDAWEKNLNALLAVILGAVISGSLYIQLFDHEEPCPLCLLQRLGMLGVATGALMNLKFGAKTAHYGLSLLSGIMGGFVALRQIALHVCPGFSKFGTPVLGLSLYTWSFIVFASSAAYIALLLLFFDKRKGAIHPLNGWGYFAFVLVFLVTCANIVLTFLECGWGPCNC